MRVRKTFSATFAVMMLIMIGVTSVPFSVFAQNEGITLPPEVTAIDGPYSQADCPANTDFFPNSSGPGTCRVKGSSYSGNYQRDVQCKTWTDYLINFPSCLGRSIIVWFGSILIWLTGWALGTAGVLLNATLELTVTGFEQYIYTNVKAGVESAWTAFRDISNIIIIGMFTYIALQMILGVEGFNARKMVARVLLIAILINFSLLFTRIIIGTSNFVAGQFYAASKLETLRSAGGTLTPQTQYATGISGQFAQLMGLASFADSKNALNNIAQNDNGLLALTMGFFTATVFLAAAVVFLYASFLLIARAILFIILLVTSSLAFASYLLPEKLTGGYGWSLWWNSLLKNAVFAPLLLLMLWATLQVGYGMKRLVGENSLGGLISDASRGSTMNALIVYLIILGMLYASIRIASKFATKVEGFNWGAMIAATPLALGGRVAGIFGRNIIGRDAIRRSMELEDQIGKEKAAQAVARAQNKPYSSSNLIKLLQKKDAADRRAKSSFEASNIGLVQKTLSNLGAPKGLTGVIKSNAVDAAKKKADAAAKAATDAAVSKDEAKTAIMERNKAAHEGLQAQKQAAHELVQAAKQTATQTKQTEDIERKHAEAQARLQREQDQGTKAKAQIEERFTSGRISAADRKNMMDAINLRIERARQSSNIYQNRIHTIDQGVRDAENVLKKANSALDEFHKSVDDAAAVVVKAGNENAREVAAAIANRGLIPDDIAADMARGLAKKKIGAKAAAARRQADDDILNAAGLNTPPSSPTP